MEIAFDSVAFALFLAAHLFAAVALSAQTPHGERGGTTPRTVRHDPALGPTPRSPLRLSRRSRYCFDASFT
jgi:hypothetical protein